MVIIMKTRIQVQNVNNRTKEEEKIVGGTLTVYDNFIRIERMWILWIGTSEYYRIEPID